jgi:hypothetical protein
LVLVLCLFGVGIYLFLRPGEPVRPSRVGPVADSVPAGPAEVVEEETPAPVAAEPAPEEAEAEPGTEGSPEIVLPALDESDSLVRELVRELSSRPELTAWLVPKGLIRAGVAVVANIAEGVSPASHLSFLAPESPFWIIETEKGLFLDPACYARYDRVADVFASLEPKGTATLYITLKPLLDHAYHDLGYPDEDFNYALLEAMIHLLEVPVVTGPVALSPLVVTYEFADPELEALSPAQRHFLRMGPRNVKKVQAKLRELAQALGIPPDQLALESTDAPHGFALPHHRRPGRVRAGEPNLWVRDPC